MKKTNISFRVSVTQKEKLQSLASQAGVSLTDFILSKSLDLPLVKKEDKYYIHQRPKVDWQEDEKSYRRAAQMKESLEVALFRSDSRFE